MTEKSVINLNGSHGFMESASSCGYCKGTRKEVYGGGSESDLPSVKMRFKTNKMQIEDYEHLMDNGFCMAGDIVRLQDAVQSCCEVYQYYLKPEEFSLSKSQR